MILIQDLDLSANMNYRSLKEMSSSDLHLGLPLYYEHDHISLKKPLLIVSYGAIHPTCERISIYPYRPF